MPEVAIEDLSIYSDEPKKIEKDVKVRSHKIITFLRESRDWVVSLPQRPTDEKLRLTALVISPLAGALAVRNNPNLVIKYLTPLVATTTVSLATFPSATMATMGSYVKLVGDGYDKMAQNQQRLLKELEVMKQKQLELQREFQRIQDEINEKAAIADAERAAKEAEILRIEAEKAAVEEQKQLELQRIADAEIERIQVEKDLAEKLALEAELAEKALLEQETLQETPALEEQTSEVLEVQNVAFERQEPSEVEEEVVPVEEPSIKQEVAEEAVCEAPAQAESVEETAQVTDATVNEVIADGVFEAASEEAQCPFMQEVSEELLLQDVLPLDQQEDVKLDESLFETVEAKQENIQDKTETASEESQIGQCPFMQEVSEETLLEDVETELKLDEALFETVEAKQEDVQDETETASEEPQIGQCPFMQEVSEEKLLEDILELDEGLFKTVEATDCPVEEEAVQDSSAETAEVATPDTQADSPVGEVPDDESKKAAVEQLKMDLREVVAEFERENFGEETKVAEVIAVSETLEENEEPMVLDESLFEQIPPSSDENVSNVLEQLVTPPSGQISNVDFGQSLKEDEELFPERSRD